MSLSRHLQLLGGGGSIVGAICIIAGTNAKLHTAHELAAGAMTGIGMLFMFAGIGLAIGSTKNPLSSASTNQNNVIGVPLKAQRIQQEFRSPFFGRGELWVSAFITVASVTISCVLKNGWPLLTLLFPPVLLASVAVGVTLRRYEVLKEWLSQIHDSSLHDT